MSQNLTTVYKSIYISLINKKFISIIRFKFMLLWNNFIFTNLINFVGTLIVICDNDINIWLFIHHRYLFDIYYFLLCYILITFILLFHFCFFYSIIKEHEVCMHFYPRTLFFKHFVPTKSMICHAKNFDPSI